MLTRPRLKGTSFPRCTWERLLRPAKFHFALTSVGVRVGSAVKLPQQVRSQVALGNEESSPTKSVIPSEGERGASFQVRACRA